MTETEKNTKLILEVIPDLTDTPSRRIIRPWFGVDPYRGCCSPVFWWRGTECCWVCPTRIPITRCRGTRCSVRPTTRGRSRRTGTERRGRPRATPAWPASSGRPWPPATARLRPHPGTQRPFVRARPFPYRPKPPRYTFDSPPSGRLPADVAESPTDQRQPTEVR